MAAVKLFAEFKSDTGDFYKVEIWDDEYTGSSPDEFQLGGDGFTLNYSGQTDNIYTPIIGSSVSVSMYVKDAATRNFLTNLKQYQQDRYYIKIHYTTKETRDRVANDFVDRVNTDGGTIESKTCLKNAIDALGGTSELYWAGYITQDIIEVEDTAEPYILQIQATDGLAKLADVTCSTNYFRVFTKQFINALDTIGVLGMYSATDPVLCVVANSWAEEMTYAATTNPLDDTWADFNALDTIDEDGTITGKSWQEVITAMAKTFGLRLYYSKGQYRLEQIFERDGSFVEHTYQKDKTKIEATTGVLHSVTIDQTSGEARLAGNMFNFLPAANSVSVNIVKEARAVVGVTKTENNDPTTDLGLIVDNNNNHLSLTFSHLADLTVFQNASASVEFYYKFRLNLRHFDPVNNVTYYLKRTYTNLTPSAATWTTTEAGSGYEILIGPFKEDQRPLPAGAPSGIPDFYEISGTTFIKTPRIPIDGQTEFDWDFVEYVNEDGTIRTLNASNSASFKLITQNVTSRFGDLVDQSTRVVCTNTNPNIQSNLSYDLGDLSLFSGEGERGSLVREYEAGGLKIRIPYGNWRTGNSGSYKKAERLLCEQFAKLMDEPVQRYSGRIFSGHQFRDVLNFDSASWVQLGGTFTANIDEWSGEWFKIQTAAITATFDDTTTATALTTGAGVNSLTNGPSVDSFSSVNLEVGDAAAIGGTLDVSGVSTLATTSVGEFTTTNRVNVTINSVTGSAGGSENQSYANAFNFVSYTGDENGTYTINLPASESGGVLQFKTDGTITANKKAQLTPQVGETIDGSSEPYQLDRSYDGITLVGFGGNWFITQKKEK